MTTVQCLKKVQQHIVDSTPYPPRIWRNPASHLEVALRNPWYKLISRLFAEFARSTHRYYDQLEFSPALLPITCGSISSPMGLGSDSVPVRINLFGEATYLADSMQFLLEYALRNDDRGVYYIMPTFRGEDPDERHLNQFFHSEAEIHGGLEDVIETASNYVHSLTKDLYQKLGSEISLICGDTEHVESLLKKDGVYPRIAFKDAIALLENNPLYVTNRNHITVITSAGEQKLIAHFGGIVWLTHLPRISVPFYQAQASDDPDSALCADLLFGIGEVLGCGERNTTYEEAMKSLADHQVSPCEYDWYLRMKRDFPMQTSGFGLGIERYLLWLLKHDDIRDIPLFPRLKGYSHQP